MNERKTEGGKDRRKRIGLVLTGFVIGALAEVTFVVTPLVVQVPVVLAWLATTDAVVVAESDVVEVLLCLFVCCSKLDDSGTTLAASTTVVVGIEEVEKIVCFRSNCKSWYAVAVFIS